MVFRRQGVYGLVAVLVLIVFSVLLFAVPAWSAQDQEKKRVSKAQKDKIEGLSDEQAEAQFVQAAQTSQAAGDLEDEEADAEDANDDGDALVDRIVIDVAGCEVGNNATITFRDPANDEIGVVENGNNARIRATDDRIIVEGPDADVEDDPIIFIGDQLEEGNLEVLSSSGIDCGDPDDDDGFDDELLLLLLLELLENNDNDDGDDGDGGDGDDGDGDLDGDGDVDQDDEFLDAQNELDDETTDGEFNATGEDDDGPAVSATAEDGQAEASTPGAVARSGGDPDNLAPLRSTPEDVEDEIPTTGPLPNTGGMPFVYWLLPLAGLLMLAGLPVYRWIKSR